MSQRIPIVATVHFDSAPVGGWISIQRSAPSLGNGPWGRLAVLIGSACKARIHQEDVHIWANASAKLCPAGSSGQAAGQFQTGARIAAASRTQTIDSFSLDDPAIEIAILLLAPGSRCDVEKIGEAFGAHCHSALLDEAGPTGLGAVQCHPPRVVGWTLFDEGDGRPGHVIWREAMGQVASLWERSQIEDGPAPASMRPRRPAL